MKKIIYFLLALVSLLSITGNTLRAGNPDRAGQAGATELLINPWARSNGWSLANSGSIKGLEAIFGNVAGIARGGNTEIGFAHTNFMQGTGVSINTVGITQKVGESGFLGLSVMSMSFGEIEITTVDLPEGGFGTYSPQYLNINFSYAKTFSKSIYGGINVKIIDESISNLKAGGFAIDAGIQYVTGNNADKDNIKFGITLRNVGTPMRFGGDGLSVRATTANGIDLTVQQRSEKYEIPSQLNIGAAYDFNLAEMHQLTLAGTFTSNSFTNDQFIVGLEYAFKEMFMIRGGYAYEKDITDDILRTTIYTGPSAGFSVQLPLGKNGKSFAIDYAYRLTKPFDGNHTFGARFLL